MVAWDARVALRSGEAPKARKALLPRGVLGAPLPAGQRLQASRSRPREATRSNVGGALNRYPTAEPIAILYVISWDACVALMRDEAGEARVTLFPVTVMRIP